MRDELFRQPLSRSAGFEFNNDVAEVFDDMINRSIPFYKEVQSMIVDFASQFYTRNSSIYDLGCSTGLMMAKMATQLEGVRKIIGIDNSRPMMEKTRERLSKIQTETEMTLLCEDLRDVEITDASVVVMNYTLQFIRPLYRPGVVRRIFEGLKPGGAFILSEKVLEKSAVLTQLFIDMYYQFKRRQGYSEMEISQKRERLENVLVPYQVDELIQLLKDAGFQHADIFFKWHNFTSIIAIKNPSTLG